MGEAQYMADIQLGEDEKTQSATIHDVDAVKTANVASDGSVYVGRAYEGQEITMAFRVDEKDESDSKDPEDTEN